jgi:hemerythrin-like metal-binding protein
MLEDSATGPLAKALDCIDTGVLVLDSALHIAFANTAYRRMMRLDDSICRADSNYLDVLWVLADQGEYGDGEASAVVEFRLEPVRRRQRVKRTRLRPNGQMLAVEGVPLEDGGYIYTFTDQTAEYLAAQSLKAASKATVLALADLAEFRDTDTGDHVVRVSRMVNQIARKMRGNGTLGMENPANFCNELALASMLHDIGKVTVSDKVLHKPGPLDEEERRLMMAHTIDGHMLLSKAAAIAPSGSHLTLSASVARSHHERHDGGGYPDRLVGEAIPIGARIVAIADVFDALIGERPYKKPWPEEEAVAHIAAQSGKQFHPAVVAAFLDVLEDRRKTPLIGWSDEMSVGVPALDRDHRNLIALTNQLALESNRDERDVIEMVLDEVAGYTAAHFRREEDFLASHGFVDIESHATQHRRFARELENFRAAAVRGKPLDGEAIQAFLTTWLRRHIIVEDKRDIASVLA